MPGARALRTARSWACPWCANRSPVPKVYFWIFTIDRGKIAARRGKIDSSFTVDPRQSKTGALPRATEITWSYHLTIWQLLRACQARAKRIIAGMRSLAVCRDGRVTLLRDRVAIPQKPYHQNHDLNAWPR